MVSTAGLSINAFSQRWALNYGPSRMRCMEVQQKVGRPSLEGLFWTTPLDETMQNVSLLCMMRGRAVLAS
ncbi:hypothetical protein CGMCC3_g5340 [Colletotrichum fructicola]|nr:uncharacterized protein CGMCC3_g5340 [Colletotrichum fructicola]KAE9578820.1 hypothetical protein CGMCC3_g5340 [Colletotrichum fructicola]KAF5513951.1 hypothetical protein CGCF413_v000410 [Colletotrichum fructicola]